MKRYYTQNNIGKCKYVVNFHDGISKHSDGSEFWGIATFHNKIKLASFLNKLKSEGYSEIY